VVWRRWKGKSSGTLAHTKEYAPKFEPTARAKTAPYSVREEMSGMVACHSCRTPRARSAEFSRFRSAGCNFKRLTREKNSRADVRAEQLYSQHPASPARRDLD
jgi:hypothetical protein